MLTRRETAYMWFQKTRLLRGVAWEQNSAGCEPVLGDSSVVAKVLLGTVMFRLRPMDLSMRG
jgi:hypothetical protein